MGVLEEILKNKEELILKFLSVIEGKETKAKINLDGVTFNVGKSKVKLDGNIEITIVPFLKKKK